MKQLITNIHQLVNVRSENKLLKGAALAHLPIIENAWLVIDQGLIQNFGTMSAISELATFFDQTIDAAGATVLPSWCDSHTHLVFAASRESEFVDKLKGMSYADIAAKGGGILNSARKLQACSEEELFQLALPRLQEWMLLGTGAMEIKSGYGLTVEAELKMLRVIKRLKTVSPIPIKASFLGAHTYPLEYRNNHEGYIQLIIQEMLPVIAKEGLADFIDVFCEDGFFTKEETIRICKAGAQLGLKAKIHANQLNLSGGVEAGIELNALSVDHLETMDAATISALAASNTIGTLLPTAAYFLRMGYQPARALIDAGAAIALASDFNPGSSPSGNMNTVVSMACIQMKMLPEEAINAATLNGAYAMELASELGSITKGKRANLIFTKPLSSLAYLPYAFGSNLIEKVMVSGKFL
ncbi:MAG: imidazolonepropionase [Bacteroidetes bacterium 24-39-8]|jgi:imidazolonepropionase|nr:MAG: imidazolonepropionase [Sphingobacteriia bacterium 35-40-8]OYZ50951.1 MAG: imidazolonepropionase [Bacteroidetes bacterium 24-39-8]OZA63449.1 MAG: imidazolonepropionase [Sphingobacteriia bacterium 39-39-8]HQR93630.1 imidazolonepropionase [Sediminibacterium sp.]HQS54197.1 imidazolonepropionase [Sediminibacterium sp.]